MRCFVRLMYFNLQFSLNIILTKNFIHQWQKTDIEIHIPTSKHYFFNELLTSILNIFKKISLNKNNKT